MKLARLSIVSILLMVAACVTEGVAPIRPASDEEQVEVNLALGVGYLQEGRADLAIEALQRALDVDSRSAGTHATIAVAYDQQGSVELAEQHHRRAAQLAPRDADIQDGYAVFLCRQGRWQDADPYFQRAVDDSPRNARARILVNAANCASDAGDFAGTERNLRAMLDINPADVVALRGMMDISIRTANYISGRAFFQRLERATQVQPEDLLSCYVIERELRDDSAAQDCADRVRREFPGSPVLTQLRELERNAG